MIPYEAQPEVGKNVDEKEMKENKKISKREAGKKGGKKKK